jgi:hypothetical protein
LADGVHNAEIGRHGRQAAARLQRGPVRFHLGRGAGILLAAAVLMFCHLRVAGTVPVLSDGAGNALATFGRPARVYHYQAYTIMVWHENLLRQLGPEVP